MIITDYLQLFAQKTPDKIAVNGIENITYKKLFQKVSNFSSSISNIPERSVVSLMFDNSIEFLISYLGTVSAGHVAHLISTKISKANLESQIKSSNPEIILTKEKFMREFEGLDLRRGSLIEYSDMEKNEDVRIIRKPKMNDYAYLLFTSGTTSEPKGVAITHSQSEFTTNNIIKILGYNSSDVNMVPIPFFHSFGLGCVHTSIFTGASLIIQKNTSDISNMLDIIENNKVTTCATVPATLTTILKNYRKKAEKTFLNLRLIMTNSTSIPITTVKEYKKILKNGHLATYYGLTEASRSTFMVFKKDIEKEASVGIPAPNVQIKIVRKNEDEQQGNILIKGKNVIEKYWNNVEADKKIVSGWLETGDLGTIDSEGYLYLVGRDDDIINVAGNKVNPYEIEKIVKELSGIEEAVIVGKKHEIFGNVIKLFIKKSGISEIKKTDVLSYCIKNMERYKVPIDIEFIDEFPRTEYGKIKRFMLQE